MAKKIQSVNFFYRRGNERATLWERKLKSWMAANSPRVRVAKNPQAVFVLGGDGTMLEAARKYQGSNTVIFGLNLGQVGFLASVRDQKDFLPATRLFLNGKYSTVSRTMIETSVIRKGKKVGGLYALNDVIVQNPLGMVKIEAKIEGYSFQNIHGTGVLVSTATGSTAYNLSAHGPIVSPDIKCLVITEILDHNIPTPSIVLKPETKIEFKIIGFRKRGLLSVNTTREDVEVMLVADGETVFPLAQKDVVTVTSSPRLIKFAEVENNYFLKSLREKFSFK